MFGGNRLEKMRGIRKRKMRQNGPRHVDGSEVIGWRVETNAELTNERINISALVAVGAGFDHCKASSMRRSRAECRCNDLTVASPRPAAENLIAPCRPRDRKSFV